MDAQLKCSQCGLEFPTTDMITYENHYVCAACKGAFVQKLKEGASIAGTTHFGGFWIRVGAKLIDALIEWSIMWVVSFIVYSFYPKPVIVPGQTHFNLGAGYYINLFFSLALPICYSVIFVGTWGATVGKMACGIKIVTADGEKVSYGRAFGRRCAELLSGMIIGIGYLMVAGDKEKRALHDRICNTRVVYK